MESPCILVCSIDLESGFCQGCGRTGDEITQWTRYTDTERGNIMASLPARLDTLERRPRRVTKRQRLAENRGEPKPPRRTTF